MEDFIFEYLQTPHIPTNKKLEVWTQYRLHLFFQENVEAKEDLQRILKSGKILKNYRPEFLCSSRRGYADLNLNCEY